MTDSSQNVQKGSSQQQTGQTGQNPGSSHQGSFDKQHEQGQKQQQQQNQGSHTPKKDVQGGEGNQENRQTGTR